METLTLLGLLFVAIQSGRDAGAEEPSRRAIRLVDLDGDDRLDRLESCLDGTLAIALNRGRRQFEEVVQGLPSVVVSDVLARDLDGDGHTDLYLVSPNANVALVGDGTGRFVEATAALGLADPGRGVGVESLDIDADGIDDVLLHDQTGDVIFWGAPGGTFERDPSTSPVEEGPLRAGVVDVAFHPLAGAGERNPSEPLDDTRSRGRSAETSRAPGEAGAAPVVAGEGPRTALPVSPDVQPAVAIPFCAQTIEDLSTGDCIAADSTPTLGRLYPLGPEFSIDPTGNVGIGTTTPVAKLDVAGRAHVSDTLTLEPQGDEALNLASGSVYKEGVRFIHTLGGSFNTALGNDALTNVTTGSANTASGFSALLSSTTGSLNTATGYGALFSNTTGDGNTAMGGLALLFNTTGRYNSASGSGALYYNTTGNSNTASGAAALFLNTIGSENTATGAYALFSNTEGECNTASGSEALSSNTTGDLNTALGDRALRDSTTGSGNTASGALALRSNTTGYRNTASGLQALTSNTIGNANTADGVFAMFDNTFGRLNTAIGYGALTANLGGHYNTAIGSRALDSQTYGNRNIAIGFMAGSNMDFGLDNIAIANVGVDGESRTIRIGTAGTHIRTFLAGIRGVTTGVGNAIPVLVDSAGQLGTVSSSRRFKDEIEDMGVRSERLLDLRPVVFRYEQYLEEYGDAAPLEYGLIAEEVAEVFPELVVYDEEGEPFTVKYHLLSSMLLNELQRLGERVVILEERLDRVVGASARD